MKIGVEANSYFQNKAGSGVYVRNIVDIWRERTDGTEILLFSSNRKTELDLSKKRNIFLRLWHGCFDIFWMQVLLPIKLMKNKVSVLFCPAFLAPIFLRIPVVVSILDMSFLRFPETCDKLFGTYLRIMIPLIKRRVTGVITISEFSKKEIIELLKIPKNKIKVIHLGCKNKYKVINDPEKIVKTREKYARGYRYLLHVGTLEPRKNVNAIIDAFDLLKRKHNISHKLILCGGKGWYYHKIFTKITELDLGDDVIFTGYMSEDNLCLLYNSADIFVFPSLYEGFGLPVLEAMACGCPVITSKCSSLSEIAGDGAVLINPAEPGEIAEKIWQILNDDELRKGLREKGLQQSKKFSWDKTADETLKYLQEAVQ